MTNLKQCQDLILKWNQNQYYKDSYKKQEDYYLPYITEIFETHNKQYNQVFSKHINNCIIINKKETKNIWN